MRISLRTATSNARKKYTERWVLCGGVRSATQHFKLASKSRETHDRQGGGTAAATRAGESLYAGGDK